MPIVPPIFIRGDDLYIFRSVEAAESSMEPVDVEPGEMGFDAEGRLLSVLVRGEVRQGRLVVDQHLAKVEIGLVESDPTHAEELRTILGKWLGQVEKAPELAAAPLAELVAKAKAHAI
jgi:hypothetical protein